MEADPNQGNAPTVSVFDMVMGLSQAMDLISPAVVDHHKRVAFIADALAGACGLGRKERADVLLAGLLHDCGALTLRERLQLLEFETDNPHLHAEAGWLLLRDFAPFASAAVLVRHHHAVWSQAGQRVPLGAHILHLADRIDVLINRRRDVLNQVGSIRRRILPESGGRFMPHLVEVFRRLSENESFWLDASSRTVDALLARRASLGLMRMDGDQLASLGRLFSRLIDFRSRFTATHSAGIAAVAEALTLAAGLSPELGRRMRVAGYLHDLGKLAVPAEILEKPARLTSAEFNIVKKHTFWSFRILENIPGLGEIPAWAAFHHEKLDGKGYPFHHRAEDLTLPCRIMAVADVFTALTEDRPYRQGSDAPATLKLMHFMVRRQSLDRDLVDLLAGRYAELWELRRDAQAHAAEAYRHIVRG